MGTYILNEKQQARIAWLRAKEKELANTIKENEAVIAEQRADLLRTTGAIMGTLQFIAIEAGIAITQNADQVKVDFNGPMTLTGP